ncbi:MAG: hypothetical protein LBP59_18395 [Planctomycetaceae bacterium]|nr:hypothetical protein [Planctomycetaceae bacterium]
MYVWFICKIIVLNKVKRISTLIVLEIQRLKSVKACRPIARQAAVNANLSVNSLKCRKNDYYVLPTIQWGISKNSFFAKK